jgi:hypothetical protein
MSEELEALHRTCMRTLKAYMEEANKTCELLNSITSFPVSIETRQAMLRQRVSENHARELYDLARAQLFEAARWN